MRYPVLVLGGYGNFGHRVSTALSKSQNIKLLIAGRSQEKAQAMAQRLCTSGAKVDGIAIDIDAPDLKKSLKDSGARLVIHTCGPFQGQDYHVARACMAAGINYIDLADDRGFVSGIHQLQQEARQNRVLLVSGASSVPGLSSAVVDEFLPRFSHLHEIRHAIAPGNRAPRGVATVKAILSYTGRPFRRWERGEWTQVYGWQQPRLQRFEPPMARRWLANCDIPDLELFPQRYPGVESVVFQAGLELGVLHLGLWTMSWLTRLRLINNWAPYAETITAMSRWFESLGTDVGAMQVQLRGKDQQGQTLELSWQLTAENGHGPHIPAIASIILAKKLAVGALSMHGAMPCMGLLALDDFKREMQAWDIHYTLQENPRTQPS